MSVNETLVGKQSKTSGGVQLDTTEWETQMRCPLTGKKVFRKTINVGLLVDSAADTTAHGITGLNVAEGAYMKIEGIVSDGTTVENLMNCTGITTVEVDATNIVINCPSTSLGSHYCIAWLEYTKT